MHLVYQEVDFFISKLILQNGKKDIKFGTFLKTASSNELK